MTKLSCSAFAALVFALGGVTGYLIAITKTNSTERSEEAAVAFKALAQQSQLVIPKSKFQCAIQGTQINDFVASYILWSQAHTPSSFSKLSCEGETLKKCTWVFGEAKSVEGSSRFLKFEYNSKTQVISPSSLECFDVP